ncbi:MAG: hypothetical protein IPK71_05820 [Myxococcales bacterium]|nr:hypothetical protein [Myxococcales bacterium]
MPKLARLAHLSLLAVLASSGVYACAGATPPREMPAPIEPSARVAVAYDSGPDSAAPDSAAPDAAHERPPPRGRDAIVTALSESPNVVTLDGVPALFPPALRRNFVLKHGISRRGERGHLVETRVSQSADPDAPRVIAWDEGRGLVVSYNGGGPKQTNGQRLDMHEFDLESGRFELSSIDFPIAPGAPKLESRGCDTCHGPRARPIFSMYPDWPGFYGSDNDELSRKDVPVQAAELADYQRLRARIPSLPRYAPLFSDADVRARFDRPLWDTFPYRPDTREDIHAVSRAFAFRPGLRLGLVLARMQARALIAHVVHHPRYTKLGPAFLATLLECSLTPRATARVSSDAREALQEAPKLVGKKLHERQAWRLFDLEIRDVDLRYGYGHEGNASDDASSNPMAIGYIGTYWNAYFDGSATLDELVASGLLADLSRTHPTLAGIVTPSGLRKKYAHLTERFVLDAPFFDAMDRLGTWIPIPYPSALDKVHHREGFGKAYRDQHEKLCGALDALLE